MNKKKVDYILKGVAAAGLAVSGVGIAADVDVVYASTLPSDSVSESQKVASDSISYSETEASLSESNSTSTSEGTSLSESTYGSTAQVAEESTTDEYLENLLVKIKAQQKVVDELRENIAQHGNRLNISYKGKSYYREADKLANYLIQYAFYQEKGVQEILHSKWTSNVHRDNFVKVTYIDQDGNTRVAFFDYVNADAEDNRLDSETIADYNNAINTDHIMILLKTPQYTNENGQTLDVEYFENGNKYYLDNVQIDAENVTWNSEEGSYTVTIDGKESKFTEAHKFVPRRETELESLKMSKKGDYFFSEKDFDEKKDDYQSESESVSESVSESISDSESVSESDTTSESVSESISDSESVSTSTSESDTTSESVSESVSDSESVSTSTSESDTTSESVSESDTTSESVSESDTTSESVSESDTTSESVSESDTTSESTSESDTTSESVSESDTTSESASESGSTPTSESSSETTSTTPSTSETPSTDIPDNDVPTTDIPDEDTPTTDLPDEDVPLAVEEDDTEEEDDATDLLDEDVPLSDNPETGDVLPITWIGTAATATAGLLATGKKKSKDDSEK